MTLIVIKAAKFGVVIMVLALSHGAWAENLLYRYKDENGGVVINDKIPQQYIDKGYTVINQYGDIIERVAPALTEEQLGQMEESERAKIEARRRQAKVDAADQKLLKTFADPEDAERARDRQLEAIDIMIEITQGNINRLTLDKEKENARAAALERSGREVHEEILNSIDSIERQIRQAHYYIQEKEAEKDKLRETFAKDIERLKVLKAKGRSNQ